MERRRPSCTPRRPGCSTPRACPTPASAASRGGRRRVAEHAARGRRRKPLPLQRSGSDPDRSRPLRGQANPSGHRRAHGFAASPGWTTVRMATLRFLVAESETHEQREERRASVGRSSGETYLDTLRALAPDAACDLVRPAEAGAEAPGRAALAACDAVFLTGSPLHEDRKRVA